MFPIFASVTLLLISMFPCLDLQKYAGFKIVSQRAINSRSHVISYCNLINNPNLYSSKIIQTKAIIVAVVGPTTDGDTILYSPDCDGTSNRMLVSDNLLYVIPEKELKKIQRLFSLQKPHGDLARAEITVSGKINFIQNKSLFREKLNFEIVKIDKAVLVEESVPWPR